MAVGDVVNALNAAAYTFVPAAGVEVVVMHASTLGGAGQFGLANGVLSQGQYFGSWVQTSNYGLSGMLTARIPINNTNYFYCTVAGSFSGIQTK
tara:strand:- start:2304 stop:2585 length:282 start_codon:yes stop_codon:yes gene_type:complete